MADSTGIEWTDATWNPVRGCTLVSPGCTNCYAMRQAHRSNGAGGAYEGLTKMTKGGPVWTGDVRTVPELLDWPLRKKKPLRIFVNSMSDLFHEDVPGDFIEAVFHRMAMAPQHTFQILTKRAERMRNFLTGGRAFEKPLPNVWLGVSVEDQARADERIPLLLQTPAAVRWISAEPLLESINLDVVRGNFARHALWRVNYPDGKPWLDWVVVGGESGPGARPMHPDWARSLRDQCAAAGVPFFFKQWGSHLIGELKEGDVSIQWQDGRREWYGDHQDIKYADSWILSDGAKAIAWPAGKKKAGRQLDGRTHDEYPA